MFTELLTAGTEYKRGFPSAGTERKFSGIPDAHDAVGGILRMAAESDKDSPKVWAGAGKQGRVQPAPGEGGRFRSMTGEEAFDSSGFFTDTRAVNCSNLQ